MDARRRILLLAIVTLATWLQGQHHARVFFPTSENVQTLGEELEDLVLLGNFNLARDRLNDLLGVLAAEPSAGPITRAPTHACSPWGLVGDIWLRLPGDVRAELRARIAENLAAAPAHLVRRVCEAVPDPELRRAFALPLALRYLEDGRFADAERCVLFLERGEAPAAALRVEALAAHFVRPGAAPSAPSADPEIERIRERIRAEDAAARFGAQQFGPWAVPGVSALPGSLSARYAFPHAVAGYASTLDAAFPAVVGTRIYAFNGTNVLALSRDATTPLWERPCPGPAGELRNILLAPAVDARCVYVARGGTVAALAREDGTLRWAVFAALDAKNTLSWSVQAPATMPALHTTPPLRAADKVFVGVCVPSLQQTTAYVAAFTPDEGALLWCVKVGAIEGADLLGLGAAPLPLAAHAGRVYSCPNLGLLAALDAEDGSVDFIRTYARMDLLGEEYAIRHESRWNLTPPVVADSLLIAAPQDSNELLGVDLRDGDLAFRAAREDGEYFLGAARERLFLVGRTLRALSLRDDALGQTVYRVALPAPAAGRGQIINNLLAVPCRDRLVFFSMDDGAPLSTHLWDTQPGGGNLAAAPWGLVAAHTRGIDVYRDINEDAAEIDTMSVENDLRRLKRARLALKTRDFQTAVAELSTFRARAAPFSTPDELRERSHVCRLIEAWTAMDIPADVKIRLCRLRADIAGAESEALSALLREGELHQESGDSVEALRAYYGALAYAGGTSLPVAWNLSVEAAPYLTARIGAILSRAEDRALALSEFNAAADVRLRAAEKARHAQALVNVSRAWPFTNAGQRAYLRTAELYLSSQNSPGAIDTLTDYLRSYPEGDVVPEALALLAQVLEAGGQPTKALATYATLAQRAPEAVLTTREGVEVKVADWAPARAAALATSPDTGDDATLRLPLRLQWLTRRDLLDRPGALRLLAVERPCDAVFVLGEEFLRVYDKERGVVRYAVRAPERPSKAGLVGDAAAPTLIIAGSREIRGVPFARGEPDRFTLELADKDSPEGFIQDVVLATNTFTVLAGTRVRCFDAAGTPVWECALPARARTPLLACGGTLLAFGAFGASVWAIDAAAGTFATSIDTGAAEKRLSAPPIAVGADCALGVYGNELCLLDAGARTLLWRTRVDGMIPAEARFCPERPELIFAWGRTASKGSRLLALERKTGAAAWHRDFPNDLPPIDLAASGDDFIVLAGDTTRVMIGITHDAGETKELWRRRLYDSFDTGLPLIVSGGSVFHGDRDTNRLLAVSARRGNVQTEGLSAVRHFMAGRLLRDYRADGDSLYVLTEGYLARFGFHDLYRPSVTTESLALRVFDRPDDIDAQFDLGRTLLANGQDRAALAFLDGVLWDRWASPQQAQLLWQLLGAAQEQAVRTTDTILRCVPAPPDVEIDGVLNEWWPLRTAISLQRPACVTTIQSPGGMVPQWEGPNDLSAKFFCAWDRKCFYFALDVHDNVVLLHDSEAATWLGDCLVIDVDPEGDGGLSGSREDRLLTLFLTVQPQPAKQADDNKLKGKCKLKVSEDRTGVVYECSFTWDELGFDGVTRKVAPGATFGFNFVLADDDASTGARQALSLNASHVLGWKRDRAWETYTPDFFPKVVLEDAAGGTGAPRAADSR